MLHHLLVVHLYRPFLKYTRANTPLPPHVSPRKICTQAASAISKLLRMYKRTYGLKQICNIVVYIAHTACTIHLLNLPEKNAQRDIIHGVRSLEEMAEGWLCARRTLRILDISASKWQVQVPTEAMAIFERTHAKYGSWGSWDQATSPSASSDSPSGLATLQSPVTTPRRFTPPSQPLQPVQRTEPVPNNPVPMMGVSMGPQYPPSHPMAPSIPSMRAAIRSGPGIHSQPGFAPEPTYLRPMSSLQYPMPALASNGPSAPSPSHNAWFDPSGNLMTSQAQSSGSKAPPVPGMEGIQNLVEESQNWWTSNAATIGLGMENWNASWSSEMPHHPSQLPFDTNAPLMSMGEQPGPAAAPDSQPPAHLEMPGIPPPENKASRPDGFL